MNFVSGIRESVFYYTNQAVEKAKQFTPAEIQEKVARTFSMVKNSCFDFWNPAIEGEGDHPQTEEKEGEENWEQIPEELLPSNVFEEEPGALRPEKIEEEKDQLLNPYPKNSSGSMPSTGVRRRRNKQEE